VSNRFVPVVDAAGIAAREYKSYDEYLAHQKEKLGKKIGKIAESDREYEAIVIERYSPHREQMKGATILCLGARLGGEVRAFKSFGALAIGVDVEPGPCNPHVLYGDFHDLKYPDAAFDMAFTNAIDHCFDVKRFLIEVQRVLRPGGTFFVEFMEAPPTRYESISILDVNSLIEMFNDYFVLMHIEAIRNVTSFVDWPGHLARFESKAR
jgi:SAM-dependent methyltransferase